MMVERLCFKGIRGIFCKILYVYFCVELVGFELYWSDFIWGKIEIYNSLFCYYFCYFFFIVFVDKGF